MLYELARKVLFSTDPETAHDLSLESLRLGHRIGVTRLLCRHYSQPLTCMGLDKNGDYFEALGGLGFGFVEIGTVTPRPQPGNPRPRVFRLTGANAMINRLGFNNKGVDHLVRRVRNHQFKGILGINIGKNFDTPNEKAADDYLHCLEKVYPYADYVTINISSPNTENLRDLQGEEELEGLLAKLGEKRSRLADELGRTVPLAVKVAPDLEDEGLEIIARAVTRHRMDAVIATNTTIARDGVEGMKHAHEAGGLSGAPLKPKADRVLAALRGLLPEDVALIGVGGICSGQDAVDKLDLGADLVQFYTGMVYRGPELVNECLQAMAGRSAE